MKTFIGLLNVFVESFIPSFTQHLGTVVVEVPPEHGKLLPLIEENMAV